jgi:hypothetical protein
MDPTVTPPPRPLNEERSHHVDPTTVTGAWHALHGRYGRRRGDRPLWWVFAYHLVKAVAGLLPYALAALLFRACGFDAHLRGGQ